MKTYYSVLNIPKSASLDEIKSAYRLLASKYHPDVNSNPNANELFKLINRAYNTLSDQEKRKDYDNLIITDSIFRQKTEDNIVETSGFWPAISNTLATILTSLALALLLTSFVQWLAESGKILWSNTTIVSLLGGGIVGILLGFNNNFQGQEIFGKNFKIYKLSFWLLILFGFIVFSYSNYSALKALV